jgi:RNA polymerase sigma-70 factor, ECF subfamily
MGSRDAESDLELVRRMIASDEEAFARFFDTAYPALYRFALARLDLDHDAAGEIAQAAVCKAIRKLHTFRGEAALLTWLCTFCRHELYDYHKQRDRRQHVELIEDEPEIRAALESLRVADESDPEAALDRTRLRLLVQRVLDHLPTHYAEALEWKYIDDVPVQEIGVRLGLGTKAAESLLTRARRAFRDGFLAVAPAWPGLNPREG